jgi:hypothetical protein
MKDHRRIRQRALARTGMVFFYQSPFHVGRRSKGGKMAAAAVDLLRVWGRRPRRYRE